MKISVCKYMFTMMFLAFSFDLYVFWWSNAIIHVYYVINQYDGLKLILFPKSWIFI